MSVLSAVSIVVVLITKHLSLLPQNVGIVKKKKINHLVSTLD